MLFATHLPMINLYANIVHFSEYVGVFLIYFRL